jgi:ClpP class serine protease
LFHPRRRVDGGALAFVNAFPYNNRDCGLVAGPQHFARNRRPHMIVLSWLWGIVKSVLNTIARVAVFAVILVVILAGIGLVSGDGLPSNMVLELDARKSIQDKTASGLLDLGQRSLSVMDIVMALDTAQRDTRVKGVFMRVGSGDLSVPKAEELRDALKRFRASGKFVIAHSQSFYSGGLGDYVVAAASDEIWMQPVSTFFSAGSSTTALFLKGLFDKVEATPQFVQRYEYKNAANMFTQMDFTPAHREATLRILQSWYDSTVDEVATDRSLARDTLVSVLDEAPVTVEDVREKGLITHIGYDDEARDAARRKLARMWSSPTSSAMRAARAGRRPRRSDGRVRSCGRYDSRRRQRQPVVRQRRLDLWRRLREGHKGGGRRLLRAGNSIAGRFAGRIGDRLGPDPQRRQEGARRRKACGGEHGLGRGIGRLLHRARSRSHSRPSGHAHRLDRRDLWQGCRGTNNGPGRRDRSRTGHRKQCAVPLRDHAME